MKFDSHWQPLRNEDAQTALVFGFLRHAPTTLALDVWLTDTLGRTATGSPLQVSSFWPRYPADNDGRAYTEPDVVIDADDGERLFVVVECKPFYGQHTPEQLAREALDASRHLGLDRLAVVLVGADVGAPGELAAWRSQAQAALAAGGMAEVTVEFRYSSWGRIARTIEHAARTDAIWRPYADDVLFRLRAHGVLDYDGAPVIDDLEGLTLKNAVEVVHRITRAFRLLALSVHGQRAVGDLGLVPMQGHAMLRDGRSVALPGTPESFETSVLLVPYARPDWPTGCGVFFAAWLVEEDGPHLQAGAFKMSGTRGDLPWAYACSDFVDELEAAELESVRGATLDSLAASKAYGAEFVYAERRWQPADGEGDVEWIVDALTAAAKAWPGEQLVDFDRLSHLLEFRSPPDDDEDHPEGSGRPR